jgi:hypothetical protein
MIHHGLENISRMPMIEQEWRTLTKNISIDRFYMYVIGPLKKDGYVITKDNFWQITNNGEAKLNELGATKERSPAKPSVPLHTMGTTYDGAELRVKPARQHAEDFMNCPSRVNNHLHYRDGTVGAVA